MEPTWNFLPYMEEIGIIYANAESNPFDPEVERAWRSLADDSVRRAAQLRNEYDVTTVQFEPYETAEQQDYDVRNYNQFLVSDQNSEHPLWTVEENVAFRTVHDLMGHYPTSGDFSWEGENLACGEHFKFLDAPARMALFTECIAQTAAVNVYKEFLPQKVFIFPNFDPHRGYIPQAAPQPYKDTGKIYFNRGASLVWMEHESSHKLSVPRVPPGVKLIDRVAERHGFTLERITPNGHRKYVWYDANGNEHGVITPSGKHDERAARRAAQYADRDMRLCVKGECKHITRNTEEKQDGPPAIEELRPGQTVTHNGRKQVVVDIDGGLVVIQDYETGAEDIVPVDEIRLDATKESKWNDEESRQKMAAWSDVAAKAKRMKDEGRVNLIRNGINHIVAEVQGDTGTYEVEIDRLDPNSMAITGWKCDCPWYDYAFQRTRRWKKFEGRPCSHTMATFWASLSQPLDDESEVQSEPLMDGVPGVGNSPEVMTPAQEQPIVPPVQSVPTIEDPIPGTINIPGTFSKAMRKALDTVIE